MFTLGLPFLVLYPVPNLVRVALTDGAGAAVHDLPFPFLAAIVWIAVIGANYTSARSEANDLRRLITAALRSA